MECFLPLTVVHGAGRPQCGSLLPTLRQVPTLFLIYGHSNSNTNKDKPLVPSLPDPWLCPRKTRQMPFLRRHRYSRITTPPSVRLTRRRESHGIVRAETRVLNIHYP